SSSKARWIASEIADSSSTTRIRRAHLRVFGRRDGYEDAAAISSIGRRAAVRTDVVRSMNRSTPKPWLQRSAFVPSAGHRPLGPLFWSTSDDRHRAILASFATVILV